ncbi:hypothetical protein Tco_1242191 [Tanacetum coccineum]
MWIMASRRKGQIGQLGGLVKDGWPRGRFRFRSLAFPDRGEDLGELFMQFLMVLVNHVSYPFRLGLLIEHKVGEFVFKLTSNNPFGVIFSFFFTFVVPLWWGIVVLIEPQKGRIIVDVSLLLKCKKRSWLVTGRPIDNLGVGHTLQFDSTPLLRFVPEAIYVSRDGEPI